MKCHLCFSQLCLVAVLLTLAAGCAPTERTEWFRDARFGMFIHWGPVSLKGTEIGWSRGGPRRGMSSSGAQVPAVVYDDLYREFNPTEFDAREWVALAQAAGMRYLVFTTKHHDGFSMFDSALTEYKITRSPFGRDVVRELADACQEAGLRLGFYYSPVDWYHSDYRTDNHGRYLAFMHGQLRELCTRYGRVDIIWFDGLGGAATDWDSERLFAEIRSHQPNVLINNRAGLPADYDTPEQVVGRLQTDRPWETCMTLGDQWSYRPNDNIKSLDDCIRILVRTIGGDGNLLLNVGPTPTGEIEPRQAQRLREIGQWVRPRAESLYGTRAGPFAPGPWGLSTHKSNRIYLHVMHWEGESIALPPIERRIVRASLLPEGQVECRQSVNGIELAVPQKDRDPVDTVVVLQLDGLASKANPARPSSGSLALGKKATASSRHWNDERQGAANAVDDDYTSRWVAQPGEGESWLEVDLGAPTLIGQAVICEGSDRVRDFELQYNDGASWKRLVSGTTLGPRRTLSFAPVTAQIVRLTVRKATRGPEIAEFQLFAPASTTAPGG
ncbi:MAG: hypothetical protein AMXMBFR13_05220 [Phycisphaerae bacterium]